MYNIYALFDLEQLDTSTLECYIRYLPQERQSKALRFRKEVDKKNCVMAYLLLLYGLYKDYGIREPNLSYSHTGKPYLSDYPDIHFNISHCPQGCICVISDLPVGVDIQDVRPFSQAIAEYCCSDAELQLLKQSADPALEFTRKWAMKESYLKMTGAGITDDLRTVDTTKLTEKIHTFTNNGCYIAIASADFFQEESICMI